MKICFIERLEADTPSIERVFDTLTAELRSRGVECVRQKLPYGNRFLDVLRNLLRFKPEPADIYHIAGHINYIALRLPPAKTIQTVHDLGILDLRSGLRRKVLQWLFFKSPTRRARKTVAISDATRRSLAQIADVEPQSIEVIPNPVPTGYVRRPNNLGDPPRVLQIGTAPHKNLERTASALSGMKVHFRVIGKLSDAQRAHLENETPDYSNIEFVDDSSMIKEYEDADIVLFCSLFEGFGMPIIEAQAIGRPVVTSDRSPMKDVAGKGAVFVDPENIGSIRSDVERLLSNPEFMIELSELGAENAGQYRVEAIAERYLELYSGMMNGEKH